ncbi:MmcQ/YjbR family DNA-binding protein [Sanguibacter sp. A247]|uniref:MmcQ/YjbR family DNA-binding protein n=1 Tax=unclassified Sanguibacter TaxID=2645534 RepID=UPI003FD8C0FA
MDDAGVDEAGVDEAAPSVRSLRELALTLPDARSDFPFGSGAEAFRIHGRMFALLTRTARVSAEHAFVNLKVEPALVDGLIAAHDDILPGWHMNKRHWVSLVLHDGLDPDLLEQLLEDSYDLVVAKLPVRLRPVTHQR